MVRYARVFGASIRTHCGLRSLEVGGICPRVQNILAILIVYFVFRVGSGAVSTVLRHSRRLGSLLFRLTLPVLVGRVSTGGLTQASRVAFPTHVVLAMVMAILPLASALGLPAPTAAASPCPYRFLTAVRFHKLC